MLRVLTFLAGLAAIAVGAGLALGLWAALVVAGVSLCGVAWLAERASLMRLERDGAAS